MVLFLKIKKARAKTKAPNKPKEEGDDKKDETLAQTNTNLIKVLIFRQLSDGLVAQIGHPIMCVEKPDDHTNLMVTNDEKRFKEDLNFQKDRIFEVLSFSNKLQNKTKKEKSNILSTSIQEQEDLVNKIATDVKLNADYNAQEEKLKLRQLKVLRSSLQMETRGNYMRLGTGGIRQYEFVAVDGILYPYFFGSKWYRVYPDLLVKKKIFNQENTIFRNEVAGLQKGIMNWIMVITLVIGLLLCTVGGVMMYHAYYKTADITLTANQGALSCTNTLAKINENYAGIIFDYQDLKQKDIESIKNTELPNNVIGNIIADPSKITK